MEEAGTIYRDRKNRDIYFVLESDGEAYLVHEPDFQQFLTHYARGHKIKDIEPLIPPEEAEGLK